MFKKIIGYFKKEKELFKQTETLHAETERLLAKEEERKMNPALRPAKNLEFKFIDGEGNVYEAGIGSKEFDELMSREDVRLIFT